MNFTSLVDTHYAHCYIVNNEDGRLREMLHELALFKHYVSMRPFKTVAALKLFMSSMSGDWHKPGRFDSKWHDLVDSEPVVEQWNHAAKKKMGRLRYQGRNRRT